MCNHLVESQLPFWSKCMEIWGKTAIERSGFIPIWQESIKSSIISQQNLTRCTDRNYGNRAEITGQPGERWWRYHECSQTCSLIKRKNKLDLDIAEQLEKDEKQANEPSSEQGTNYCLGIKPYNTTLMFIFVAPVQSVWNFTSPKKAFMWN